MSPLDEGTKPGPENARAAEPVLRARLALVLAGAALAGFAFAVVACGGPAFVFVAGGADGGGSDGGAGSTDAGTAGADATPFCALSDAYDFCADFDESPLSAEWNNPQSLTPGASGAEDADASVSMPNSYLALSPALAAVDAGTQPTAHAILTQSALPKGPTHIAFDIRIDQLAFPNASDPNASVIAMAYTQGPDYALVLAFHPVPKAPFAAELVEASTTTASMTPMLKVTPLPGLLTSVGVWYSVTLDFTIDGSTTPLAIPASIGVTSGSPPTTSTQLLTLSPPLGTAIATAKTLSIGVEATAAVEEAKLRFDNVTYQH